MTDDYSQDTQHEAVPTSVQERPSPSQPRRSRNQLSGLQVMFAAILAIGMVLGISLSSRVASSQPLRTFYNSVETEIAQLRLEQSALIEERDFALSDAFVEQWARADGKMVRPGEVLVVVVPETAGGQERTSNLQLDGAQEFVPVDTTPPEPEPWELWWSLFFDSEPPFG